MNGILHARVYMGRPNNLFQLAVCIGDGGGAACLDRRDYRIVLIGRGKKRFSHLPQAGMWLY